MKKKYLLIAASILAAGAGILGLTVTPQWWNYIIGVIFIASAVNLSYRAGAVANA